MRCLDNISISQLLENLTYYGHLILKILLLYIIVRISSGLSVWIWRTLIVPIFRKRAYFYYYQNDGFYTEERPFGLFRRIRNIRWTIKDKMVGYVEKNRGDIDSAFDHAIYLKSHGRSPVGGAIYEAGVCKIYLNEYDKEGGCTPNLDKPVGFIDNGKIYKYYADRESWLNDVPLDTPEFIGDCECPRKDWFGKKKKTKGEKPDEDVLCYIEEERDSATERVGFKDSWPYFRKNCYRRKKVATKQANNGISVQDGKTFYAMLCSKLWRFLHVYPTGWDCKAMAWGYGYCTEDWRNPFNKNDDHGTPMICRAAAALLLARYEGFTLDPDEIPQRERRGPIPTVLLSFLIYLVLYGFFQQLAGYLLFPFMGAMMNETVILIALFFVLWLFIIHPIRLLVMERTDTLESFLEKLNINVGVTGWMVLLIIISICGIIASLFWIGYEYFPVYVCALTTIVLNWSVFNARRWPIEGYGISRSGVGKREYHEDDRTEGRRRKQEKIKDNSDSDNQNGSSGLAKDEDRENGEKVDQVATLNTPTRSLEFRESLYFDKEKLKKLRIQNPSRRDPQGMNEGGYTRTAANMVEQELRSDNNEGDVYSKVKRMAALINTFSSKNNLSSVEKIQLIMAICQPPNIEYKYDESCDELMVEGHNTGVLIEGGGGYKDYCRFPSESLHDKHGDCDCHAALVGALFVACGYGCCYLVGNTTLGAHAAVGLEITEDLIVLRQYKEAVFSKDGKDYLYVETAGRCMIGQVPDGFDEMLKGDYYPIEPTVKLKQK